MNAKNIILVIGLVFFTSIVFIALLPDDFWDQDVETVKQSRTPQITTNHQGKGLAQNNTNPSMKSFLGKQNTPQGNNNTQQIPVTNGQSQNVAANTFYSAPNMSQMMQPVALNNQQNSTQQFSFAGKSNITASNVALNSNRYPVINNVAMINTPQSNNATQNIQNNNLAMQNGQFNPGVIQQAPQIFSDAFPPSTHDDGRNIQNCSMCHQVLRSNMGGKERLTNNQDVSVTAVNYSGMILKITGKNAANGWTREHIWLKSQTGDIVEIVLAPAWFLNFIGCQLNTNVLVKGIAFEYQSGINQKRQGQDFLFYAKNIIVDGQLYRLRSDMGLPLWSN